MTKDEALKLALEALEEAADAIDSWGSYASGYFQVKHDLEGDISKAKSAITAIRETLSQPEQEPVVWMYQDKTSHAVKFQRHMSNFVDHSKTSEIPLYSEPLANHELQCVCGAVWCGDEMVHLPNKAPPQRKPLTDEEIDKLPWGPHEGNPMTFAEGLRDFARAIEAKLKEKNT